MVRKIRDSERRIDVAFDVRATEGRDRTLTFIASTERVASDGDIVKADAWDLESRFRDNPQVLWSHDKWALPIGRGVDWRIVTDEGEPRLEVDVEFAGPDQGHEFADQVYLMYLTGFMRAVSVGFIVRAYEKPDDDDRAELGLDQWGVVVTKAELIELSAVTVGADPAALVADGQVSHELKEAVMAARAHAPDEEHAALDEVIEGMDDEVREEAPEVDPLSPLISEVAALRAEVVALREDLRVGGSVETPEDPPEDSERDPDWYGELNAELREIARSDTT